MLQSSIISLPSSCIRQESTTAVRINHNTKVNGPVSTLPAPLVLPERGKDDSFLPYVFKLGRGCTYTASRPLVLSHPPSLRLTLTPDLSFYKTGVKNVWANYKTSRALRDLIARRAHGSLAEAASSGVLSRGDVQLLRRSAHDVKRVPMFALIYIIFGEFSPLVVVYVPALVPWPCRTPQQILRERTRLEDRRRLSFRNLVAPPPPKGEGASVRALQPEQVLHVGRSLGLLPRWVEWLGGAAVQSFLRRSIASHVEYVEMDDRLIERDGGPQQMEMEEVRMALVERGLDTLGKSDIQVKAALRSWLWARSRFPVYNLFLTRYVAIFRSI